MPDPISIWALGGRVSWGRNNFFIVAQIGFEGRTRREVDKMRCEVILLRNEIKVKYQNIIFTELCLYL